MLTLDVLLLTQLACLRHTSASPVLSEKKMFTVNIPSMQTMSTSQRKASCRPSPASQPNFPAH